MIDYSFLLDYKHLFHNYCNLIRVYDVVGRKLENGNRYYNTKLILCRTEFQYWFFPFIFCLFLPHIIIIILIIYLVTDKLILKSLNITYLIRSINFFLLRI